jgi:hypothetical protein
MCNDLQLVAPAAQCEKSSVLSPQVWRGLLVRLPDRTIGPIIAPVILFRSDRLW